MAISLENLNEIWDIAYKEGKLICRQTTFETESTLPQGIGEGIEHYIHLRGGLDILIYNLKLQQDLKVERHHSSDFPLVAKFYLSGSSRVRTAESVAAKPDYAETAGCHYLYHLPDINEVEEWPSNELHHVVMIYVPTDYFRTFCFTELPLPLPLKQCLDSDQTKGFHQSLGQITPAMHLILQQILHAPYQGMMQQLYLESKALELLALQFSYWAEAKGSERSRQLSAAELDRLHAARTILMRNVGAPSTLADLAQKVGLNEYRLKQGFRQVFDITPTSYLYHCRMQQALHLLRHSDLSIAGVAIRVGYRNPEAFSTAFRRKFNISPKAYQLGKCDW